MVKQLKCFRLDPELYARFKTVASAGGLLITEALEKFMQACVDGGSMIIPVPKVGAEAEAGVMLTWLRKDQYWYRIGCGDEEYSVVGRLLQLIAIVEDSPLRSEIEEELKKY